MIKQWHLFDEKAADRALELVTWLKADIKKLRSQINEEQRILSGYNGTLKEIERKILDALNPKLFKD
jgi:hypothetical protein